MSFWILWWKGVGEEGTLKGIGRLVTRSCPLSTGPIVTERVRCAQGVLVQRRLRAMASESPLPTWPFGQEWMTLHMPTPHGALAGFPKGVCPHHQPPSDLLKGTGHRLDILKVCCWGHRETPWRYSWSSGGFGSKFSPWQCPKIDPPFAPFAAKSSLVRGGEGCVAWRASEPRGVADFKHYARDEGAVGWLGGWSS